MSTLDGADTEAVVQAAAAETFGDVQVTRLGTRSYRVVGEAVNAVGWFTETDSVSEWLTHLARIARGCAPVPVAIVTVPSGVLQFVSWLPGTPFNPSDSTACALGQLVATLHQAAGSFMPSPAFQRHMVPEQFGPAWLWEDSLPDFESHGAERRDLALLEAACASREDVMQLLANFEGIRSIVHYDLHAGNLLTLPDGSVGVVDWEDSAWGYRAMDLAIAWFYVPGEHRAALLEGYASLEPVPAACGRAGFDRLLIPRWLSLYSWELDVPSSVDKRERYLSRLRTTLG